MQSSVNLPKTKLKEFAGEFKEWSEFINIFEVEIDQRKDLFPCSEIYISQILLTWRSRYIRPYAKDHGPELCDRLQDSFGTVGRYHQDSRRLFRRFILNYTDARTSRRHSFDASLLRSSRLPRASKNLNEPIYKWDSLLAYFIRSKLDKKTRMQFHTHLNIPGNTNHTVQVMCDFLNQLA